MLGRPAPCGYSAHARHTCGHEHTCSPLSTTQEETCLSVPWLPLAPRCSWPRSRSPVVARAARTTAARPAVRFQREQGRQDRRHRAPVRRPGRPRQGHQELGRPRHQAGQRGQDDPGLDPRARGRGRPGHARRRQERRDQARGRQGRRRRRRHAELQRRAERAAGPRAANIVQVSPGQHQPGPDPGRGLATAPKRTYKTYFRTCTTDAIQGPFAARYLFEKAGIKKVATVHDKKTYGQGLAATFTEEFKKLGGKVVAAETINPDDDKYDAVISKIKPSNPKAVYYGGEYPQAGPSRSRSRPPASTSRSWAVTASTSATSSSSPVRPPTGDLATSVGAPTEELASAKEFVANYKAGGYTEPYEAYGGYSYDAAKAIIKAVKVSRANADSAEAARQATVDAMGKVSFDGVTGKVAFDEYGDTTSKRPHRLQGRGRQVGGREDRGVQVNPDVTSQP